MFTGIVTDLGRIISIEKQGDWKLHIATQLDMNTINIGDSIACSGVCLTVVEKDGDSFKVQVSQETLRRTHIGTWDVGTKINLESSLRMGDQLGGHLVFGHVDGLGEILQVTNVNDSLHIELRVPQDIKQFMAIKGSVALDGISLTINGVEDDVIQLMIIPHTQQVTTWKNIKEGVKVHIETDILARYVARILETKK